MRKICGIKSERTESTESARDSRDLSASTSIIARGPTHPSREELTDHYMDIIRKYETKFLQSATGEVHRNVSSSFLIRLKKIDNDANGNIFLKLITYQEWVDMLLHLNDSMVKNLKHLEMDVNERMLTIQKHLDVQQKGQIMSQYQNDIRSLVQILKNGYYDDDWNFENIRLDTLDLADILVAEKRDTKSSQCQIVTTLEIPVQPYDIGDSSLPETEVKDDAVEVDGVEVDAVEVVPDTEEVQQEMDLNDTEIDYDKEDETGATPQPFSNKNRQNSSYSLKTFYKGVCKSSPSFNDRRINRFSRAIKSESFITPTLFNITDINIKYQISGPAFLTQDPYDDANCKDTAQAADNENLMYPIHVNSVPMNSSESESRLSFENLSYTELGSGKELKVGDSLCALAAEVASKHDEVLMLNKQIMSLEDEIQKSFQKIQLKDDVIKELRVELKSLNLEHKQKRDAYSKLDYLRQQLVNITEATDREHLDFIQNVESQLSPDSDDVALSAIRKQILNFRRRVEANEGTMYEIRLLNTEMEAKLQAIEDRKTKGEQCLKEMANFMTAFLGAPLDYKDIYEIELKANPFCAAVLQFKEQYERKVAELTASVDSKDAKITHVQAELSAMEAVVLRERNVAQFRSKETAGRHHLSNAPDTPSSSTVAKTK